MENTMKLIVGLGNPGKDYMGTRHNIGFGVITRLSDKYNIGMKSKEHKAVCGKGMIGGEKVILAQPQTFMNLSGESVKSFADYYKIEPEDIIVAFDDIDLEVGQIRVRRKGSAGGHNGIKNIIAQLGSNEFPRVKVGVGAKPEGGDLIRHVLGHFSKEDEKVISEVLDEAADAVEMIVTEGVEPAMNRYNAKRK
jgi:PTH1 family peptidyl-tRNA hydrolase